MEKNELVRLNNRYAAVIHAAYAELDEHNGEYTELYARKLIEAAKIQLEMADGSSGSEAAECKRQANELWLKAQRAVKSLRPDRDKNPMPIKDVTAGNVNEPVVNTGAGQPVDPAKSSNTDRAADKAASSPEQEDEELKGFDVSKLILQPNEDVTLDSLNETIPQVTAAVREAIYSDFDELFPNLKEKKIGTAWCLYGPPGTGKTQVCRGISNEIHRRYGDDAVFFLLAESDIKSKFVGVAEKKIQKVFAEAKKYKFAVVCCDDADSLCAKRGDDSGKANYTGTFLVALDGAGEKSKAMFILNSNNPWNLDPAMVSRLKYKYFLDYPGKGAVQAFFTGNQVLLPCFGETEEEQKNNTAALAERLSGRKFSFRNLVTVSDKIKKMAKEKLRELYPNGSDSVTSYPVLGLDAIMEATEEIKSDYEPASYQKYLDYQNEQ